MQLYKAAIDHNDAHAAAFGLVEAKLAARLLSDDFAALDADLISAIRLDKTKLPEGYAVPKHYGYSR